MTTEEKVFRKLADVEKEMILAAVEKFGAVEAAGVLGIGKTTVYRRLKEYGIKLQPSVLRERPAGA